MLFDTIVTICIVVRVFSPASHLISQNRLPHCFTAFPRTIHGLRLIWPRFPTAYWLVHTQQKFYRHRIPHPVSALLGVHNSRYIPSPASFLVLGYGLFAYRSCASLYLHSLSEQLYGWYDDSICIKEMFERISSFFAFLLFKTVASFRYLSFSIDDCSCTRWVDMGFGHGV
jgi:hypothetical protein